MKRAPAIVDLAARGEPIDMTPFVDTGTEKADIHTVIAVFPREKGEGRPHSGRNLPND